ncbi:hypothetical protein KFE25_004360 [Diacronema lutheri]|uniref:Alpha-1,4-N-acetylglucosaminyltransferase n=1 Tax=Diacronema lutheri TaxID=2081491 RepID=A0A8J6C148_DIALT|nr:hypothetical protein KFE25_004360 [Diacronema lutheri]
MSPLRAVVVALLAASHAASPSVDDPWLARLTSLAAARDSHAVDAQLRSAHGRSLVHLIAAYADGGRRVHLCVLESLIRAAARSARAPAERPVAIVVWVSNVDAFRARHGAFVSRLYAALGRQRDTPSVLVLPLSPALAFEGTPLARFFSAHGPGTLGPFEGNVRSNALRLALVHRFGGLYLDLDHVVLRDVRSQPARFIAYQAPPTSINNGLFRFEQPGHPWLATLMAEFSQRFEAHGREWGGTGPSMWDAHAKAHCPSLKHSGSRTSPDEAWCAGIARLPFEDTAPILPFNSARNLVRRTAHVKSPILTRLAQAERNGSLLCVHLYNHEVQRAERASCLGTRARGQPDAPWAGLGASGARGGMHRKASTTEALNSKSSSTPPPYASTLIGSLRARHCPAVFRSLVEGDAEVGVPRCDF